MNLSLQACVVMDATVDRHVVELMLTSSPRLSVIDYFDIDSEPPGSDRGDVLVIACGDYSTAVTDYISESSRSRPNRPVVLLTPASPNGYASDAIGHGADDVVTLPAHDAADSAPELAFALEKALARRRGAPVAPGHGLGEMICILGLKGGSGKTLTAANLSVALADAGQRVIAVDLDLQFGDLGLALGLTPDRTLYDLVRAGGSLDPEKVADFTVAHPSGVRALLAPTRPDRAGVVTSDFLREVFQVLREMSDFVIVDTPPGFTPEAIVAVDSSTSVCMVAMLDSLSLKNTKLGLETLDLMDYDSAKVRFVLNRADSKVGIDRDDFLSIVGSVPSALVPSDRNVTRSINRGEPIALSDKRSEAAQAYHALAKLYSSDNEPPAAKVAASHRRRLLRRR
jgi:pilus assembly protein CpaE